VIAKAAKRLWEVDTLSNRSIQEHQQQRDRLIADIVEKTYADRRFVAAWLTGSLGRGTADALSDVDLTLVVKNDSAAELCMRERAVTASPNDHRMELFRQFGRPTMVHENNHNAPDGGTFTAVLYHPSSIIVDWTLIPQAQAFLPDTPHLLFAKEPVPKQLAPILPVPERDDVKLAADIAFFWMMSLITAKYIVRGIEVLAVCWLDELGKLAGDIERQLAGQPWQYQPAQPSTLPNSANAQALELRALCRRMERALPALPELGDNDPALTLQAVEMILGLS
jgi:hypothetical protein